MVFNINILENFYNSFKIFKKVNNKSFVNIKKDKLRFLKKDIYYYYLYNKYYIYYIKFFVFIKNYNYKKFYNYIIF